MINELEAKLGLKASMTGIAVHLPADHNEIFPKILARSDIEDLDLNIEWIIAFYTSSVLLENEIQDLVKKLSKSGQLWLCWPKKTSGLKSDLSDIAIREIGIGSGLVDVKVAAISEKWSGLKFVFRIKDRL